MSFSVREAQARSQLQSLPPIVRRLPAAEGAKRLQAQRAAGDRGTRTVARCWRHRAAPYHGVQLARAAVDAQHLPRVAAADGLGSVDVAGRCVKAALCDLNSVPLSAQANRVSHIDLAYHCACFRNAHRTCRQAQKMMLLIALLWHSARHAKQIIH